MQKRRAQNERYIFGDGGKDTWYNGVTQFGKWDVQACSCMVSVSFVVRVCRVSVVLCSVINGMEWGSYKQAVPKLGASRCWAILLGGLIKTVG